MYEIKNKGAGIGRCTGKQCNFSKLCVKGNVGNAQQIRQCPYKEKDRFNITDGLSFIRIDWMAHCYIWFCQKPVDILHLARYDIGTDT